MRIENFKKEKNHLTRIYTLLIENINLIQFMFIKNRGKI